MNSAPVMDPIASSAANVKKKKQKRRKEGRGVTDLNAVLRVLEREALPRATDNTRGATQGVDLDARIKENGQNAEYGGPSP